MSLQELKRQSEAVASRAFTRMRRLEGWHLAYKVALILIGGTVATAAQFMSEPASGELPWKPFLGVGGALMALMGGMLVAFIERDAPQAFEDARKASDQAQTFLIQRDQILVEVSKLRQQFLRERHLSVAGGAMREAVEQSISKRKNLKNTLDAMMNLSVRSLTAAMGFEAGERWTVSIFRCQDVEGEPTLVRLSGLRADRAEEGENGRNWRSTEGFAGACFTKNGDVILPDAQSPGVLAVIHIPVDKKRETDSDRYKSVAAVPIRVDGLSDPWGVAIATSDIKNRFDNVAGSAGAAHAEPMRLVSGMAALAVVAADVLIDRLSETGG